MNSGTGKGISIVLRKKLLQFNGGLFSDFTVLPVNGLQLGLLKEAAKQSWSRVEPAIFGTLLERALNPAERHKLGAHYTPRAYVERLVLPTVVEPLRAEWRASGLRPSRTPGRGISRRRGTRSTPSMRSFAASWCWTRHAAAAISSMYPWSISSGWRGKCSM